MQTKIDSLQELSDYKFSSAEMVSLYDQYDKPVPFKGVRNLTTGKVCAVVSKQYGLVDHNSLKTATVNALRQNSNIGGYIKDYGNNIVMDIYFKDDSLKVSDDKDGIMLGFRVSNSYNKTGCLKIQAYGFRLVCSNGMVAGKEIGINLNMKHTNSLKISRVYQAVSKFKDCLMKYGKDLQRHVNTAQKTWLTYHDVEKALKARLAKKHNKWLLSEVQDHLKWGDIQEEAVIRAWDFYNLLTRYATHVTDKKTVIEQTEKLAYDVLREKPLIVEKA